MTTKVELNTGQIQRILELNKDTERKIKDAAQKAAVSNGGYVFLAAFDGTNNDMNNVKTDAFTRFRTNVAQLWDQYRVGVGDNRDFDGEYYPGVGTKGQPFTATWLPDKVTAAVREIAEQAYDDFVRKASRWLEDHPGRPVTVALTAFSRGAASAAIFSQLLCKKGLVSPLPSGNVLIQPGKVGVSAGVLFDPVATGVTGNLAYPPNVANVVGVKALNEYRYVFKAVDYSKQKDVVTTLDMFGNHCDVGGGYDNGLAALSLEAATEFLEQSGLPITNVPDERKLNPTEVAVHSEQKDGDQEIWSVYNETGFSFDKALRLCDNKISIRPASGGTGGRTFELYDGTSIAV